MHTALLFPLTPTLSRKGRGGTIQLEYKCSDKLLHKTAPSPPEPLWAGEGWGEGV